jgi:peptide/nickel transport system permease protein
MSSSVSIDPNEAVSSSRSQDKEARDNSPWRIAFRQFIRNKLAISGTIIMLIIILACVFVPMFMPYTVLQTFPTMKNQPPSWEHWLGTDKLGRDVLFRTLVGGRISLLIGFCATIISVVVGVILGVVAGYYRKWVDTIIMRFVEIFSTIPTIALLLIMAMLLSDMQIPPNMRIYFLMVIIGLVGWTGMCRLVRGQLFSLREQEYMQATDALGLKDRRKIFRHMLPNIIPIIIVSATLGIAGNTIYEASLSFLGLGVMIPNPSWGNLIGEAMSLSVIKRPWIWLPSGLLLCLVGLAINIIGDALRDAIDPKMKV